MSMAGSALEGEGVRQPDAVRLGRGLPAHLAVSHRRARVEGMVLRVALAVCAVAVCSAQCPPRSAPAPFHNATAPSLQHCLCNPGYSGPDGGECVACPSGTYKRAAGSGTCSACPPGSFSSQSSASTFCSVCPPGTFLAGDAVACRSCPSRGSSSSEPLTWSNCTDNAIFLSPQDDWKARIQDAPHGSTVFLFPGVYVGECNVRVQRNITLRGVSGKAETVLDCQLRNRHLHVTGASVTIEGLTLTNGHAGSEGGGCVLADGNASVAISGSSLAVCSTLSHGGLLRLGQSSQLLLSDQTELRNGSAGGHGGGVFLEEGSLMTALRNVLIVGNTAGEKGGGVFSGSSSVVDLGEGVEIRGCFASLRGGGVMVEASSTVRAAGKVSIVGNVAGRGGGVHATASVVDLGEGVEVRGCVGNVHGGGIYLVDASTLRAAGNVSVVGNTAESGSGGGMFMFGQSVADLGAGVEIRGCHAGFNGGGVYMQSGAMRATGKVSIVGNEAWSRGGGLSFRSGSVVDLGEGVEVRGCVAYHGGGIDVEDDSMLRATGKVSVVGNTAGGYGGGFFGIASEVDLGEGVEVSGNSAIVGGGIYMQLFCTVRSTGNVSIVGNEASSEGGGLYAYGTCEYDLGAGAEISGNVAGAHGGGVCFFEECTLRAAVNVSIVGNEAGKDGGGIYGFTACVVDLGEGVELSGCVAGDSGGGVYLTDGSRLRAANASIVGNEAGVDGGCIFGGMSSVVDLREGVEIRRCVAGRNGGGVLAVGGVALTARDSWFDECVAGGLGGAMAVRDRSTASLAGSMLISRSSARDGGGIFAQGLGLEFAGETLTVRGNSAAGRGGGIASWTPLHLIRGSAILASNQAHVGGGWCGIGYEAVLSIGADANLMVENCSAASDGGGMALMDLAAVEFEPDPEPCPSGCSSIQSCSEKGACLVPQCNFNGGACERRFVEAGLDAAQPCDREKCSIVEERFDVGGEGNCGNGGECLVASCDWAEGTPPCRMVLDDLRACPLFDAVAYDSIMRLGSDVMFVKEGGTANGFGRCANASCHVAQNGSDSYEWCETIDDGGRVLEQICKGCVDVEDRGQAWGVCSPGRPRLPSAGFDYDAEALLALLRAPVEDVMQQHPGCGRNPLRFVSNEAGGKGGGLYSSGCHTSRESKGTCFIGDIAVGFEPAVMVLFQGNSAAAGGGLYSACPEVGVCAGLMDKRLGLPSSNQAHSSIFEFRDNRAVHGDRAASAANKLVVTETAQAQLVPGQDALNVTLLLLDSLNQRVDGRIDPYVIEMVVCLTPAGCSSLSSLQPVLFLAYDEAHIHTAERSAVLQYCTSESSSVVVKLTAVTADRRVEAALEVECLPCQRGQTRTRRAGPPGRGGPALWSCERCAKGEYVIDPNQHSCQKCPRGLACDGTDEVEPVVAGSTWEKAGSYFNLTSCPTGYAVVNEDEHGFSAEEQRCEECEAGEECTTAKCETCAPCQPGHYKPAQSTAPCEACPADSYRRGVGGRELAACRLCPALSTTRGRAGQVSISACQCQPGFYSHRTDAELECFACPVGATCPDGVSLVTRGGLDATGEVVWGPWQDDTQPGRMWLKQCPQGYRLENQTGFERQECQPVPPGMFIASNAHPSFQFQRCPANMFCLNGGPPIPVPVSALLTLSGLPPAAAWTPAHSEAVRQSVRAAAGDAQLQVELTEACFGVPDGTCQPLSGSATRQRRAQPPAGPGEMTVGLQTGAVGRSSEEVKAMLESSGFAAGFEGSMDARGIPDVRSNLTTQPLLPALEGVGTYALVGAALVLKDCPVGFLIVNASLDEQECFKCPRGAYSIDPTDGCLDGACRQRDCNSCPNGALCAGGSHFAAKEQNITWEVVRDSGAYSKQRLTGCPAGSILVRDASSALALNDECVTCPYGKYSLLPPAYPDVLAVGAAPLASELCLVCDRELQCDGGSRIKARRDYWLLRDVRSAGPGSGAERRAATETGGGERRAAALQQGAVLIPCPPKACRDDGLCSEGHLGPVCGVCRQGWVMSGGHCRDCGSRDTVVAQRLLVGIGGALVFLAVFTRVALQPAIYGSSMELEGSSCLPPCLANTFVGARVVPWIKEHLRDVHDHLKVIVSFFQVVSTYRTATSSQWGKTSDLFDSAALVRLGLNDFPWFACISSGSSYQDVLLLYTVTPIVICLLLVSPLPVLRLLNSPNLSYCINEAWKAVGLFLFLVYPTVSIVSISSFNCQRISDDLHLLIADYREPCPSDDPAGFVFGYSVFCVLVFPLGIILAAYVAMRLFRVPQLAQRKVVEIQIHAMILLYIRQWAAGRQEKEDLHRRRQRAVSVARLSHSTDQSDSGLLRGPKVPPKVGPVESQKVLPKVGPVDSFRLHRGSHGSWRATIPAVPGLEQAGDCPFEGHETEAKLSEDQIVTLLTHDWRPIPGDEAEVGKRDSWVATIKVPGLESWRVSQLRACSRPQLLALLREAARRLRGCGVLAVPAVAWDPESVEEAERQAGHRVGFLLLTYRPEYWYWELVELARKFFTACATVFVWRRSVRQLALVLGVTVIALLSTMRLEPYRSRSVLNTQLFSLFVQCVTLMYGLTMRAIESNNDNVEGEGQAAYAVLVFLFAMVPAFPLLLATAHWTRDEWVRRTLAHSVDDAKTSQPASRESLTQSDAQIPRLPSGPSNQTASPPPPGLIGYSRLHGGSGMLSAGSTLYSQRRTSREASQRALAGQEPVEPDALGSAVPPLDRHPPARPGPCAPSSTSESPAHQPIPRSPHASDSTTAASPRTVPNEAVADSDSARPHAVRDGGDADTELRTCVSEPSASENTDDAEAALLQKSGPGAPGAGQAPAGEELVVLEMGGSGEAAQAQANAAETDAWVEAEYDFEV